PVAMAELGVGGERFAKALFPLFTLCLYGVLFEGLVRAPMPRWLRVLAPFAVLLTPQMLEHTQSGYANLALAVYLTLAVILWARWLYDGDARLGIATAITLTGVVWVRPDGEVYAAYLILIALGWQILKRRPLRALVPLALPVIPDLAWKVFYALNLRAPS